MRESDGKDTERTREREANEGGGREGGSDSLRDLNSAFTREHERAPAPSLDARTPPHAL